MRGEDLFPEHLGLPADRGWVEPPEAGTVLPGATLELRAGVTHGVAAPRRTLVLELRRSADGAVVARDERALTVVGTRTEIALRVAVPEATGVDYALALEAGDAALTWDVQVPAQVIDARLVCEPALVRAGEALRAAIHTGTMVLQTGSMYGLQRWEEGDGWVRVGPFDDDEEEDGVVHAWTAVAHILSPGMVWPVHADVPSRALPGRHRLVKSVDAEWHGVGPVQLAAEFTVRDAPPVDYAELLGKGAWAGVRPGAARDAVSTALGPPDEATAGGRVWRYGDLQLHFAGDVLHAFFGRRLPHRVREDPSPDGRPPRWTETLPSGADLQYELAGDGGWARLLWFRVAAPR
jgi:hypothetical protein